MRDEAKAAFEAWRSEREAAMPHGARIPPWDELPDDVQQAWDRAAQSVPALD